MRIGIVSVCDVYAFKDYLDEESRQKVKGFRKNAAPSVNNLVLGLLKRNYRVVLFTTDVSVNYLHLKGSQLDIYVVNAYSQYPLKHFFKVLIDGNRLSKVIRANVGKMDVLHAHWTYEFALGSLKVIDKVPVFCTVRDWAPVIFSMEKIKDKFHWFIKLLVSKYILNNTKINFIANSEYIADRILKSNSLSVPVLHNILNTTFNSQNSIINETVSFKFVSISMNIDKWKNIETLLHAFKLMQAKFKGVQLLLIGPPFTHENPMINKWRSQGLINSNIVLVGKVTHKDLPHHLDECSVLVHPSLEESFGNTIIEAMARKLAVIGGENSGAVPFLLEHGKSGCLCDVNNAQSLFKAMELLYLDSDYRKRLVENAFVSLSRFNEEYIIQKHLDLYTTFIKEPQIA